MKEDKGKRWGGRFSGRTDEFVEEFTESVSFDERLYGVDLDASIAHADGLFQSKVLSQGERDAIVDGLEKIRREIESGEFDWSISDEDVHTNIESRLVELVGEAGKNLHSGRSRNDQVVTDLRLWLRREIDKLDGEMTQLLEVIVDLAESHVETIMPGLTHMRNAQPITFGHHLMAWFEMLLRDRSRLRDCRKRLNQSPLGAGALAGASFPLPREETARNMGFDDVCRNSLDAVSDRDFAIEFTSVASMAMTHFSRWCEEIILWNSDLVGFIELPDAFCTGSSMMPQKKNPDVPELIRGKTGRVVGDLTALLVLSKSQPLAYNRDNQEDKERLFDAVDTLSDCIRALIGLIPEIQENTARMYAAASKGFPTATDLADWLVNKGVAFRDAHEIVGRTVAYAESRGIGFEKLTIDDLKALDDRFDQSALAVLTLESSIQARSLVGGTAPDTVREAIRNARERIQQND